jgi:hypothetical protein
MLRRVLKPKKCVAQVFPKNNGQNFGFVVQSGSHTDGKGLSTKKNWVYIASSGVFYRGAIAKGQKSELAGA